jgi:HlyD family secretion protein
MSIQEPVIEFVENKPSHRNAWLRRQRQASLPLHAAHLAGRPRGARLAWAAFAILAGLVVVLAGSVAALLYALVNRPTEEAVPSPAQPAAAIASSEQQPAAPSASSGDFVLDSKGFILPVQRIVVSPKVSGMIVKLNVREGSHVKKGDVLAELEDMDYHAEFYRAQWALDSARQQLTEAESSQPKEIGQAEAEMERAKVELAQLQADFARTRDLYFQQAASTSEYESSGTKFRAAEQHVRSMDYALGATRGSLCQKVATAHTQVEEAEADLAKARYRLKCCMVRAPSSGTILKMNAEEGSLASGSASLCELANLSELEVEVAIPDREIRKIKPGQRCQVRTEAFPDRTYDGVVSRVMPVANRVQSAIPIRVKIAVPQEEEGIYLKPEMIAQVSFLGNTAIARVNETGKAFSHSPDHKQDQPAPVGTRPRSLQASG